MPSRKFLTVREVCSRFHVSRSTLDSWARAGRLRPSKFGRAVRFSIEDIERCERAHGFASAPCPVELARAVESLPPAAYDDFVSRLIGLL